MIKIKAFEPAVQPFSILLLRLKIKKITQTVNKPNLTIRATNFNFFEFFRVSGLGHMEQKIKQNRVMHAAGDKALISELKTDQRRVEILRS